MKTKYILDIETNRLVNPDKIWCIITKDVETGDEYTFRNVREFTDWCSPSFIFIGHNLLSFDIPVLHQFGSTINYSSCIDTLVLSRLVDSTLDGHSLKDWGERLGIKKEGVGIDFSVFSESIVERCISDVRINYKLYHHFKKYLESPKWKQAITLEHETQVLCNELSENGFAFSVDKAKNLLYTISCRVDVLTNEIRKSFPPKTKFIKEITPRGTKFGTINRSNFRGITDLSSYSIGCPFSTFKWEEFNPGSSKQVIEVLNEAGWKPTEKTKSFIQAERNRDRDKLRKFRDTHTGWKINEQNLGTLPSSAPLGTRYLAQWIALKARQSDLEEWLNEVKEDGRIHGRFTGIGSWTHRMSHSKPNQSNIYRPFLQDKSKEPTPVEEIKAHYNSLLRSLWTCDKSNYLVGVDAESIQLRVLAHYINDKDFIYAVTQGKKEDGTDPHSLNQRALGEVCKSRDDAKTFIYAFVFGAGVGKLSQVLGCSFEEAKSSYEQFISFYPGLKQLRDRDIPSDAAQGFFRGLDGRYVKIIGRDRKDKERFCLAGYLQNGEAIITKTACVLFNKRLKEENIPFKFINFVHDEFVIETQKEYTEYVKQVQIESIIKAGTLLNLNCPMNGVGSVGQTWLEVH